MNRKRAEPIHLREQVKCNIKRFPDIFMFKLNDEEVEVLLSQNAIPSRKVLGGSLPYVFTEQGVANQIFKALENGKELPKQGIFFDGQLFDKEPLELLKKLEGNRE